MKSPAKISRLAPALVRLMLGLFATQSAHAAPWVRAGALIFARNSHTATLLLNGRVLVAGGNGTAGNAITNAELYDPASGVFTVTNSMNVARESHTATLLSSGKVLVAAGFGRNGPTNSAELYDPINGTWKPTDPLPVAVYGHSATLLPNGKVLVAGGQTRRRRITFAASTACVHPENG